MDVKFLKETKRDEQIRFHYREIDVDGTLFCLEYCSGPSLLGSGRMDQLFMQITVVPPPSRGDVEVYTLKRYPFFSHQNAIAEHIIVNTKGEVHQASDRDSLNKLVEVLYDNREIGIEMTKSYPPDFGEPLESGTERASDLALIDMYLKHIFSG
ncbi:MAG: hypothetical protein V1802_01390 [Candidatus Aenigmatarchaeota archaeon]